MSIRIMYDFDTWDAATIFSTNEAAAELAVENVLHDHVGLPWRTEAGETLQHARFDLGAATRLTCVAIMGTNYSASASIWWEGNTTNTWGSPGYSQQVTIATDADGVPLQRTIHYLDATYRYWRLYQSDASNADGYLEVGAVKAGQYWEPSRSINDGFLVTVGDPSSRVYTPGAWRYARTRPTYRTLTADFSLFDRTQHSEFDAFFRHVGNTKPVVVGWEPTNYPSYDGLYGVMTTPLSLAHQLIEQYSSFGLTFEELTY